jgi:mRNA interferase RelE/StbE
MYDLALSPRATRVFEDAPASLQRRLDRCLRQLREDPRRRPQIKALSGPLHGYWRYRVGDYRVVYRIDDAQLTVWVDSIAHRREVYR